MAFSPFHEYMFATGAKDNNIKIWNLEAHSDGLEDHIKPDDCALTLKAHTNGINQI